MEPQEDEVDVFEEAGNGEMAPWHVQGDGQQDYDVDPMAHIIQMQQFMLRVHKARTDAERQFLVQEFRSMPPLLHNTIRHALLTIKEQQVAAKRARDAGLPKPQREPQRVPNVQRRLEPDEVHTRLLDFMARMLQVRRVLDQRYLLNELKKDPELYVAVMNERLRQRAAFLARAQVAQRLVRVPRCAPAA